jgi:hypothetical protein
MKEKQKISSAAGATNNQPQRACFLSRLRVLTKCLLVHEEKREESELIGR